MKLENLNAALNARVACIALSAIGAPYFFGAGTVHAQTESYVRVYEYANEYTGRRVLLADPAEVHAVANGAAGAGWFKSSLELSMFSLAGNGSNVSRFYSPLSNSHFYTANAQESDLLKQPDSGWIYEKVEFKTDPLAGGTCIGKSAFHPVYRYYNNRAAFGESAHRFSPNRVIKAKLEAEGWLDEGIAFCTSAYTPGSNPYRSFTVALDNLEPAVNCSIDDTSSSGTSLARSQLQRCVSINHQPAMPSFYRNNWEYMSSEATPNAAFTRRTGLDRFVAFSALNVTTPGSAYEVDAHSFVQREVATCGPTAWGFPRPTCTEPAYIGVYVNGRDRFSARSTATSISPVVRLVTAPPAAGEPDQRVMPWRGKLEQNVEISFRLQVKTLSRANEQSHAYGHATIALTDLQSWRRILINISTFSLEAHAVTPETDFIGSDNDTGAAIVSTVFRKNPAFGEIDFGTAFVGTTGVTGVPTDRFDAFKFRIRPQDVAAVVKKARTIDPLLSASIANYAIDSFGFKNEVVGDAEIGMKIGHINLAIFAE